MLEVPVSSSHFFFRWPTGRLLKDPHPMTIFESELGDVSDKDLSEGGG